MRFEQLVLHLPGDEFRLRFNPRVTVVSGVEEAERAELLDTVVRATAGAVPNASLVFTDHTGRRIFADRTGATYGDTAEPAPTPAELVGSDPSVLLPLMTIRAGDLGLAPDRSLAQKQADLDGARKAVEELQLALLEARVQATEHDELTEELADLDRALDRAEDDAARWAWCELGRRADRLRAELAVLDHGPADDADGRLLDAVEEIRQRGSAWAEVEAELTELRERLGDRPSVSGKDLARVAQTPAAAPDDLDDRVRAWERAVDARRAAEIAADEVAGAVAPAPGDALVGVLARLDQDALWADHRAVVQAEAAYEAAHQDLAPEEEVDPDIEAAIEAAHVEVVRHERRVQRARIPGLLLSTAMVASTLLTLSLGIVATVATLAAAVAAAVVLLVRPARALKAARDDEDFELGRAGAATWLGLHLRRLDDPADPASGQVLEAAATARVAALVDWRELVGDVDPDEVGPKESAIRAHHEAIDPAARQTRIAAARQRADEARDEVRFAIDRLLDGLDAYGIGPDTEPAKVPALVASRVAAGQLARDWVRLAELDAELGTVSDALLAVLERLGFAEGSVEQRLDRAVQAITAAQERRAAQAGGTVRSPADVRAELDRTEAERRATERAAWTGTPDPTEPPTPVAVLTEERQEAAAALAQRPRPDVMGAERRLDVMVERVAELEQELGVGAEGPAPLHKRLIARVARTTWQGGAEESVPALLDDPLASVDVDQRCDLLDMLLRLADKTQVIYLTADPVVARWARARALDGEVLLLETGVDAAPAW